LLRLLQLSSPSRRCVAAADGASLLPLARHTTLYDLAVAARQPLAEYAASLIGDERLDYGSIWEGQSEWRILPVVDHPSEPARCLVTGTGLTHLKSAANRDAMHAATAQVTDSMRMYQWGVEGGRPPEGTIGVAPEWFYKGSGLVLRAHNDPLDVPWYAEDGGEEPEIAGIYIVDSDGNPRRIGFAQGNEFSDHQLERRNYLYLAGSKLRNCAVGPEVLVDADFRDVPGEVAVERGGSTLWSKPIRSGEAAMCHSLANLEHHHFKFEGHRRPGDVHVHFFGADAFSFGEGIQLQDGDIMRVSFDGFGRPLRNPLRVLPKEQRLWSAGPL
jgi:hypothetical protein